MSTISLLIDNHSFTLLEKGKSPLQKNFGSDEECFELIKHLLGHKSIAHLNCCFSGSRLVSRTETVHYNDGGVFSADKGVLSRVIENIGDQGLSLIEKEIVSLAFNGYPITEAAGQQIHTLKAGVFLSGISKEYKSKFLNALDFIPTENISLHSASFFASQAVYNTFKKEDFILCISSGDTIDISVKKGQEFFETMSVDTPEKIKDALTHLSEGVALPSDVYISAPANLSEELQKYFSSESYHSLYFTNQGWSVHTLDEYSLFTL